MTKEELIDFLKDNMWIDGHISQGGGNYGHDRYAIEINIFLCGEIVASGSIS